MFRVFVFLPAFGWFYLFFWGDLGAEPIKELSHQSGEIVFYFLMLNLFVGAGLSLWPHLMRRLKFLTTQRRFFGILTFCYLLFHSFCYFALESFEPVAFDQILTKTYLQLGFSAWLILAAMAVTSNNLSTKKLGFRRWKWIHRGIYCAYLLVAGHVLLIEKADLIKYGLLIVVCAVVSLSLALSSIKKRLRPLKT